MKLHQTSIWWESTGSGTSRHDLAIDHASYISKLHSGDALVFSTRLASNKLLKSSQRLKDRVEYVSLSIAWFSIRYKSWQTRIEEFPANVVMFVIYHGPIINDDIAYDLREKHLRSIRKQTTLLIPPFRRCSTRIVDAFL